MDEARAVVADFCEKNPSSGRVLHAIAATPRRRRAIDATPRDADSYS